MQFEIVNSIDLRVGDVCVAYTDASTREYAMSFLDAQRHKDFCYEFTEFREGVWKGWSLEKDLKTRIRFLTGIARVRASLWFEIVVRTQVSGLTEFPHLCPRCGTKAYVGLIVVEHAVKVNCPAGGR